MMTPAEVRRAEAEAEIAIPLNRAWKQGFKEGEKRVAQAVERAINLTVRTCEDLGGKLLMRHVDAKKIAALAIGTDTR